MSLTLSSSIEFNTGQQILADKILSWYRDYKKYKYTGNCKSYYVYSGAAGTGKTTVVKAILNTLGLIESDSYIACAFVGKAVLNLQKHKLNAKTIHSLIYTPTPYEVVNHITGRRDIRYKFELRDKLDRHYDLLIVDEASMVNDSMKRHLLSFGIPIIFLGDMHQLPAVIGLSTIMDNPDFILTQIMRQKENDPIIRLSQMILNDIPISPCSVDSVTVTREFDIYSDELAQYSQVLCLTNRTRAVINSAYRKNILGKYSPEPSLFERVICRQNNWYINVGGYSLTNGLSGKISNIDRSNANKGYYLMDFRPDDLPDGIEFENLVVDRKYLIAPYETQAAYGRIMNEKFEYAYGITVHLSQGSEYDKVIYLDGMLNSRSLTKKARYTAITRARKKLLYVQPVGKLANILAGFEV